MPITANMTIIANRVFVSHSRKDSGTKGAVRRGLAKVGLKPLFVEELVVGRPQMAEIKKRIENSAGFFVFFTRRSTQGVTRDWICFEMGLAKAHGHDIYSWKRKDVRRENVPVFLPELSKLNEYTTSTPQGVAKLERQVEIA